jgi:hypothetical protein
MRTVWIITFAALALAIGAWAQAPGETQGRFYGPLVPGNGASKFFRGAPQAGVLPLNLVQPQTANAAPKPAVMRCVVPLIEMKAPKAIDPGIQIAARIDKVEPMPQAKVPPVCEMPIAPEQGPDKAGAR